MARSGNKLDTPAKNRVGIVLTDEQLKMLDECCWEYRWTRTDVIRAGIERIFAEVSDKRKNDR